MQTLFGFHQSGHSLCHFSTSRSSLWFHIAFSHYILLSFDLWQNQSLFFFMIWTVLKSAGQVFHSMFPKLGLPDIFLMRRLGCGFSGKISWRWSAPLIASYQGCTLSTWFITGDTELNPLVKVVFASSFHCKVTIFPSAYALLIESEAQSPAHSRGRKQPLIF